MDARIEIEAHPSAIDHLTDEFDPVERPNDGEVVFEEDMAEIIEVVQLQGIPTDAWEIHPQGKDWKPAQKKPVQVEYRGPFTDPTVVATIEGDFEIDDEYIEEHGGYYLIRGVEGEVYPCGVDVFEQTFVKLND